jgi:hypothetical protein
VLLTEWFSAIETEWLSHYSPLFARVGVLGEAPPPDAITGIKGDPMGHEGAIARQDAQVRPDRWALGPGREGWDHPRQHR